MNKKMKEMAYAHQKETWEEARDKELLAHSTGTGKTLTALGLCLDRTESALIFCPLSVLGKWVDEIEFWCDDFELIEKEDRYRVVKADGVTFYITTKEFFRDNLDEVPGMEAIVVDEAHHVSGMKSKMSKAVIKYVKHYEVKYRWLLTATPFTSSPWQIYRLAQVLNYDWSYPSFENKYFKPQYFGQRRVMTPKDDIEDDMAKLVNEIGRTVRLDETMDVPDQIHTVEKIEINDEQKRARRKVIEENLEIIVKYTRVHQVENSILVGDEYNKDQTFRDNKLERIQEYVNSSDKIAIVCRYRLQLRHLKEKIKTDKDVYMIHGGDKDREETIKKAQDAEECVVLVSAGVSEGYELATINVTLFVSLSYGFGPWKQFLGRTLRKNNPTKNLYVYLLSTYSDEDEGESVDEAVYRNVVVEKQDFHAKIFGEERENGNMNEI